MGQGKTHNGAKETVQKSQGRRERGRRHGENKREVECTRVARVNRHRNARRVDAGTELCSPSEGKERGRKEDVFLTITQIDECSREKTAPVKQGTGETVLNSRNFIASRGALGR